jgi:WD40 repeat protein
MREGDFDTLNAYIAGNSRDLYILTAPGGMGKTMFLANWIRSCQQQNGSDPPILYRFIGVSEGSTTIDAVLRSFLAEMREIGLLQEEIPIDPNELRNKFPDFLTLTGSRGRCIVVIDALNQLESGLRDLHWLPWKLPAGIKMIVSFKREGNEAEDLVSHLHESLSGTFHEIRPFESRDDRKKLVSAYLNQYLKQLDDTFIQELIDSPGAQNPLFLKVVLSELRIYGSFANLGDKIRKDFGINPVTAFGAVLKRLENDPAFTSIPPETTVPLFFGLISHARVGLSENELIDLYIREVSFEKDAITDAIRLLLRQMRPFLAIRSGRYDFFYESFRLAAIDRYEGTDTEKNQRLATKWHRSLADYFEHLPAWASQKDNIPTLRRASQLPYHLAWAGKSDHLADLILEYELLESIVFGLGPHVAIEDISYVLSPPVLPESYGIQDKKDGLLLIKDTITLSAHILAQKPNQLPGQLVGRLLKSENPVIRKFIDKLNQFDRYSWLRPVILSLATPSGPLIFTLYCHTSGVLAVAVTPDCRRVISGHDDNILRIWDLQTGRELTILKEHTDWVTAIAITPDGKRAISGSKDETLKIWDLESGQVITTLAGHTGSVNAVALIPDGHHVISGSDDTTLKVWDLESGREIATFMGHAGSVFAVAVTPDGKHAVSGSMDTTLKVWDLKSGNELATLYGHSISVKAVAITPDGLHAISGSWDTTLKVWDLASGQELFTLPGHIGFVEAVALSHDGYRAISGSEDNLLKVWDLKSGRELATLTGHSGSIHAVAITPDSHRVISGSEDNTLKVWDLGSGRKSAAIAGHTRGVTTVAVTPDGQHAISGSRDTTLKIWDLESGQELTTLPGHISSVLSVTVSPDGLRVISASEDKTLKVWDLESGRELATLTGHTDSIKSVVVTPDSCRAISGSDDKTLKVWDLKSGRELLSLTGHTHRITAVVVTPDGRRAVSGSWDQTMKVWDLESGRELATFTGHTSIISAIVVTPDGRRAVSGSWDKTLKVWDLESGRELLTLTGHTHWVETVTLTQDGFRAVSTSFDKTLKVWDLESGRELLTLTGHTGRIKTVAVTLDGRRVISGSDDKTLKVWNLENGTIVTEFYSDGEILTCGYTDMFDSIIVGDEIGRIYILHFETGKLDTC